MSNYLEGIEDPGDHQVHLVTAQMLARKLLWDLVPCSMVETIQPLLNLHPDSPDVADMEHHASHERLDRLIPLEPLIQMLVPMIAGITSAVMLVNSEKEADAETVSVIKAHHEIVVTASVSAVLANLIDLGIIQYTPGVVL